MIVWTVTHTSNFEPERIYSTRIKAIEYCERQGYTNKHPHSKIEGIPQGYNMTLTTDYEMDDYYSISAHTVIRNKRKKVTP